MMQLAVAHVERLRDSLRASSISVGEIRRVEGAGEQYIALSETEVDEGKYTEMYTLSIDGLSYVIYAKLARQESSEV